MSKYLEEKTSSKTSSREFPIWKEIVYLWWHLQNKKKNKFLFNLTLMFVFTIANMTLIRVLIFKFTITFDIKELMECGMSKTKMTELKKSGNLDSKRKGMA